MSESPVSMVSKLRKLPSWAVALVAFLILALALIAANLIYATQVSRDRVLDGSPGALLYVSAFSGFSDEWDLYDGQQSAKLVEEQLELRVAAPQTATWSSARPRFRDFDLSVSVTAIEGPIDNAIGVVFQAQSLDADACDLPAVILCGIDRLVPLAGAAIRQAVDSSADDFRLAFLISSDGYYSLRKTSAGQTRHLSAWIATPHIKQGLGETNTIRIIARDSRFRLLINGAPVSLCIPFDASATSTYYGGECIEGEMRDSYRAESSMSGNLGLIAQSTATGGGGVVVRFDNLLVFSPANPADGEAKL